MYLESQLLPLSALQHLLFCERQCALIHIEQQWVENRFTAEGAVLHRAAHSGKSEKRRTQRTARSLPVRSLELGLYGISDIVRFDQGKGIVPVEYKRGKPKKNDCDRVQLCAQALCLEEMLSLKIPHGDIFYGETRRHTQVLFDDDLRERTRETAKRLHEMIRSGLTPAAELAPKCKNCSLRPICVPELASRSRKVSGYFQSAIASSLKNEV